MELSTTPSREPVPGDIGVDAPAPPPERVRARVPRLAALLPVPVAFVLAAFLGPHLLAFALLGPVLVLGNAVGDRMGSGRSHRRACADHEVAMEQPGTPSTRCSCRRSPVSIAPTPIPTPCSGPPSDVSPVSGEVDDLRVRLGHGDVPTRVVLRTVPGVERPPAEHAPVVLDLTETSGVTVCGPPERVDPVLAGLLGQLLVGCPPSVLRVAVVPGTEGWEWVARTPHAVPPPTAAPSDESSERSDLAADQAVDRPRPPGSSSPQPSPAHLPSTSLPPERPDGSCWRDDRGAPRRRASRCCGSPVARP